MTPQDDLPAERAATDMYNRLFSVMRLPEHEQHAKARLKLFYQVTRQDALREAAERLGVGDSNGLLAAPCLWCGYNGEGYYQAGTHSQSCPWHTIGGCDDRLGHLAREGVR